MKVSHFDDKPTRYLIKSMMILLPMLIVPMVSYEYLIFYFKHSTVIYSSMMFGFMLGLILLLVSDKIPKKILRK